MPLEDDVRLVTRILDGDRDALNERIAAYRPLIFAILIRHMYLTRDDAVAELSARDRDLIRRRYFLGQTYKEIGRDLGMTPNHAGVALFRAQSRLKEILIRQKYRPPL